jgi:hypothetical protein
MRFEHQILQSKMELEKINKRYLKMQTIPINRFDSQPRKQILQRKSHGKTDARGLTGAEIATRQLNAGERAEKKAREQQRQIEGESQGEISITLAIRNPKHLSPASTAPPRLQKVSPEKEEQEDHLEEEEHGQGKRRRIGSLIYKKGRKQGLIRSLRHSQPQHHA